MYDIELNNGVKMPVLGLGIYKMTDEGEMKDAVQHALAAGYRSFDTAQMYGNEGMLGNVLEKTDISRENLFFPAKWIREIWDMKKQELLLRGALKT